MPSRLKLAGRWVFKVVGDLRADLIELLPFVAVRAGGGISMEKFSLLLLEPVNGLTELAAVTVEADVVVAEWGESPVEDGDMLLSSTGLKCAVRRIEDKLGGRRCPDLSSVCISNACEISTVYPPKIFENEGRRKGAWDIDE